MMLLNSYYALSLFFLMCGGRVYWAKPSEYQGLTKERGIMLAPIYYDHPEEGNLRIYIERYRISSTSSSSHRHLILLSGGPGQRGSVWRDDLVALGNVLPHTTIYLLDQRGVGRSSRMCQSNDISWRNTGFNPDHHPDRYSINGAARDVGLLAKNLKGQVSLMGVSYGGLLAARVVTLYPNRFRWLILDSPSMIKDRFNPSNDKSFWNTCLKDEFCVSKVRSSGAIRRAYDRVLRGRRDNACLSLLSNINGGVGALLKPFQRGTAFDIEKYHPAMLIIPFILQAYQCPDVHFFKHQVLSTMKKLARHNEETSFVTHGRHSHRLHDFHNSYICISEIFKYPRLPEECKGPETIADQCGNWHHYYSAYNQLEQYRYEPDDRTRDNPIDTKMTNIVLLVGELDLVTPPPASMKWFEQIRARKKILLKYGNMGHALVPTAPCLKFLFRAIDSDKNFKRNLAYLGRCMKSVKNHGPDWKFTNELSFARSWWRTTLHPNT